VFFFFIVKKRAWQLVIICPLIPCCVLTLFEFRRATTLAGMEKFTDYIVAWGYLLFFVGFGVTYRFLPTKRVLTVIDRLFNTSRDNVISDRHLSVVFWLGITIAWIGTALFWFYGYFCTGNFIDSAFAMYAARSNNTLSVQLSPIPSIIRFFAGQLNNISYITVPVFLAYTLTHKSRFDRKIYRIVSSITFLNILCVAALYGTRTFPVMVYCFLLFTLVILAIERYQLKIRTYFYLVLYGLLVLSMIVIIPHIRGESFKKWDTVLKRIKKNGIAKITQEGIYALLYRKHPSIATIPQTNDRTIKKVNKVKIDNEQVNPIKDVEQKIEFQYRDGVVLVEAWKGIKEGEEKYLQQFRVSSISDWAAWTLAYYGRHTKFEGPLHSAYVILAIPVPRILWRETVPVRYGTAVMADRYNGGKRRETMGGTYAGPFIPGYFSGGYVEGSILAVFMGVFAGIIAKLSIIFLSYRSIITCCIGIFFYKWTVLCGLSDTKPAFQSLYYMLIFFVFLCVFYYLLLYVFGETRTLFPRKKIVD
jgi:hypothetical protein